MSTIFVCDGCGRKTEIRQTEFSPSDWYGRNIYDDKSSIVRRTIHACSRPCIEIAAKKFEVHSLVFPA